ncbi:MAG: methionyl-tRNA formyltransferase [Planctomycetota bacterium]|jgi:methionyl-tRNA formyltransferase
MKIAIIGRTQILYETVLKFQNEGFDIGCIITAAAAPEYSKNEEDFKSLAEGAGIPFFISNTLDDPDIQSVLNDIDLGVSLNWVSVIRQKHIDLFGIGILNSHHGDLPAYRGNACTNWAIINNEKRVANSIHLMEGDRLDCGRIICQQYFDLDEDKTITDIYNWAEETTPDMFVEAVKKLTEDNSYTLKYADPESIESFRCYPRLPEDGFIDWQKPVADIHNLIRALCCPFPGAYTYHKYKGEVKKLHILKSRIVSSETKDYAMPGHVLINNSETGESLVKCGDGILALKICRYDSDPEEFQPGKRWQSIRMRLGIRSEDWLWEIKNS